MKTLMTASLNMICGAMNLEGRPGSENIIDQRGIDKGVYIDANGACWAPGTPSIIMYPNGGGPAYTNGGFEKSSLAGPGMSFCQLKGLPEGCL
ncbi:hypothetical protein [Serratia rubidaea]|uniref:hypothetical protein n=1 Tax=Serratia rubidaea TaxID=61652 RepID=UPI0022B8EBDB|nr:hypothetical protein [Serratia rubidaea]WBF44277.1 hypothetical protein OLD77_16700 [Serratia rubidaea]